MISSLKKIYLPKKKLCFQIGIIHQFQFSSRLQRMSVITRHLGSRELTVYCKGSPEMITSLSNPDSGTLNVNEKSAYT